MTHRDFIMRLSQMTGSERLAVAMHLSEYDRLAFLQSLRDRFPGITDSEIRSILRQRNREKTEMEIAIHEGRYERTKNLESNG